MVESRAGHIGSADGINFYAYVGNNPVNFNDPMGLDGINVGVSAKIFGEGLRVNGSVRFPGFTPEPYDAQLQVGLTPGMITETFLKIFDPNNPLLGLSHGFELVKTTLNLGFDFASSIGSGGPDLNLEHQVGYGYLGMTASTQNLTDPRSPPIPSSFQLNIGPQLGASISPEVQFTASARDFFGATGGLIDSMNPFTQSKEVSGGFVLYPSKPNTSLIKSVYSK